MKLLLHACCGPCSLEPVRVLQAEGHHLTIAYLNSNIAPESEYLHRRDELVSWCTAEQIAVREGAYNPAAWEATAGVIGEAALRAAGGDVELCAKEPERREARCRACYRLRFEEAARMAAEQGFEALGTTLSVSPYQFTAVIEEELRRAAEQAGVHAVFADYRPFYDEATRRSRELGMYRQNYCGCRFSDAEAEAERLMRKRERMATQEEKRKQRAASQQADEESRAKHQAEQLAYAQKQAKKRAVLKALRAEARSETDT